MVSKQNKSDRSTEHFVRFKWRLKKNPICQRIASVARLTFIEWRSALKKEGRKNFKSKYQYGKVKSLKRRSTLVCIFSMLKKKKIKNKIKVHKVHKIYHYN